MNKFVERKWRERETFVSGIIEQSSLSHGSSLWNSHWPSHLPRESWGSLRRPFLLEGFCSSPRPPPPPPRRRRRRHLSSRSMQRCGSVSAAPASGSIAPAISLTEKALNHVNKMRSEKNDDLCLRIGVKQGGCSGMSYTMEFESRANARPDVEYSGFVIVCDPKSLLFLYGMQLDFSDALIGTCGCGKSFAAVKCRTT